MVIMFHDDDVSTTLAAGAGDGDSNENLFRGG